MLSNTAETISEMHNILVLLKDLSMLHHVQTTMSKYWKIHKWIQCHDEIDLLPGTDKLQNANTILGF